MLLCWITSSHLWWYSVKPRVWCFYTTVLQTLPRLSWQSFNKKKGYDLFVYWIIYLPQIFPQTGPAWSLIIGKLTVFSETPLYKCRRYRCKQQATRQADNIVSLLTPFLATSAWSRGRFRFATVLVTPHLPIMSSGDQVYSINTANYSMQHHTMCPDILIMWVPWPYDPVSFRCSADGICCE